MPFRELNHAKCKTYLAYAEGDHVAALIDPVRDHIDRYIAMLAYFRCRLEMIIDTHTHADHRSGASELADLTGAPVVMHRRAPAPHVAIHVDDGQTLRVGDLELRVLYTPGHSEGSLCLYVPDEHLLLAADSKSGDVAVIRTASRLGPALFTMLPVGGTPVAIVVKAMHPKA